MKVMSPAPNLSRGYGSKAGAKLDKHVDSKLSNLKARINSGVQRGTGSAKRLASECIDEGAHLAKLQVDALEAKMSRKLHGAFLDAQSSYRPKFSQRATSPTGRIALKVAEHVAGEVMGAVAKKAAGSTDNGLSKLKERINHGIQQQADSMKPLVNGQIQHGADRVVGSMDTLEHKVADELHKKFASGGLARFG